MLVWWDWACCCQGWRHVQQLSVQLQLQRGRGRHRQGWATHSCFLERNVAPVWHSLTWIRTAFRLLFPPLAMGQMCFSILTAREAPKVCVAGLVEIAILVGLNWTCRSSRPPVAHIWATFWDNFTQIWYEKEFNWWSSRKVRIKLEKGIKINFFKFFIWVSFEMWDR